VVSENKIVYRNAKEICAMIGEDYKAINNLIKHEGLPAWRRNNSGTWRALHDDLVEWLSGQRDKYLSK